MKKKTKLANECHSFFVFFFCGRSFWQLSACSCSFFNFENCNRVEDDVPEASQHTNRGKRARSPFAAVIIDRRSVEEKEEDGRPRRWRRRHQNRGPAAPPCCPR